MPTFRIPRHELSRKSLPKAAPEAVLAPPKKRKMTLEPPNTAPAALTEPPAELVFLRVAHPECSESASGDRATLNDALPGRSYAEKLLCRKALDADKTRCI